MIRYFFVVLIVIGLAPVVTFAQEGKIPDIIMSGLNVYKEKGPEAAVKEWIKGSPVEGQKNALSQANVLLQVEAFYGTYKSVELINIKNVTSTAKMVYVQLNYENGPVFAYFVIYNKGDNNWIVTNFQFHTDPASILPREYVS
jgi:hypothetical protein